MAVIAKTDMTGNQGARTVSETTLGASDTFVYTANIRGILVLRNPTGGGLTPKIDGDGGTTFPAAGYGDVDVSAGLTLASIPATTGIVAIPLDTIREYLKGTVTVTGGTGLIASILEY